MGSFTGDILRMLAHQGLQTGGTLLGQALAIPLKSKADLRELAAKQTWEAAKTAPEAAMPNIASMLKSLTGRDVLTSYQAPTGNVLGPGGDKLAMTPMAGAPVTPETAERFIRPPVGASEALGGYFQKNPKAMDAYVGLKTGQTETLAQQHQRELKEQQLLHQQTVSAANQAIKQQQLETSGALAGAKIESLTHAANAAMSKIDLERYKFEQSQKTKAASAEDQAAEAVRKTLQTQLTNILKLKDDPNLQGVMADTWNEQVLEAKKTHGARLGDFPMLPVISKEPGYIGKLLGTPPKRVLGESPGTIPSPGVSSEAATKTVVKTGVVQSGPNKGKRVTLYSDGTQSYE